MKVKLTESLSLKILTSIGALLYCAINAMMIFYDNYPIFKPFGLLEGLLIIFIVAFVLAWANKYLAAGILFMIWNTIVWLSDLYFFRAQDYSMLSALASYFMFCGAFFLLEWYKTKNEIVPSKQQQWKFILRVLLVNYIILYTIVVFSEITVGEPVNYLTFPYILYPIMFLIFLMGFLISWKREVLAGYIFLLWFVVLIFANVAYSQISTLGGWALFGFPLLLQGIFYINNHYKLKNNK